MKIQPFLVAVIFCCNCLALGSTKNLTCQLSLTPATNKDSHFAKNLDGMNRFIHLNPTLSLEFIQKHSTILLSTPVVEIFEEYLKDNGYFKNANEYGIAEWTFYSQKTFYQKELAQLPPESIQEIATHLQSEIDKKMGMIAPHRRIELARDWGFSYVEMDAFINDWRSIEAMPDSRPFLTGVMQVIIPGLAKMALSRATSNSRSWAVMTSSYALGVAAALAFPLGLPEGVFGTFAVFYPAVGLLRAPVSNAVASIKGKIFASRMKKRANSILKNQGLLEDESQFIEGTATQLKLASLESIENSFPMEQLQKLQPKFAGIIHTKDILSYGEEFASFVNQLTDQLAITTYKFDEIETTIKDIPASPKSLKSLNEQRSELMKVIAALDQLVINSQSTTSKLNEFTNYLNEEVDTYMESDKAHFEFLQDTYEKRKTALELMSEDVKGIETMAQDLRVVVSESILDLNKKSREIVKTKIPQNKTPK